MLFLCIKPLDLLEVAQSELKKKGPRQQGEDCLGHGVSKTGSTWQPMVPDAGHAHVENQKLPCGMPFLPIGFRHAANFALLRSASSSDWGYLLWSGLRLEETRMQSKLPMTVGHA